MLVDNIFSLVNGKQEDQLSSGFGFVLKNHRAILKEFLHKIGINLSEKELKSVDIETQTTYDFGESRIDLHLLVPNRFLIFLESKIVTAPQIDVQLSKYAKILKSKRDQYEGIRLVYVNKFPLREDGLDKLRKQLGLDPVEFHFFSWEDLLSFTKSVNKEIIKLFSNYIGDSMFSKKIIAEQKIKNVADVLVIFTKPEFMEFIKRTGLAVQLNGAPDARYIAILETHRPNGQRSAITHIAEVEYTENNVPRGHMLNDLPKELQDKLATHMSDRGYELSGFHKQYKLKLPLIKLIREIPHVAKGGPIVKFRTSMAELLRAETTKDIRKGKFE